MENKQQGMIGILSVVVFAGQVAENRLLMVLHVALLERL